MRKISIKKIILYSYLSIGTLVIANFFFQSYNFSDKEYLYLLAPIRDCIWYGFDENGILYHDQEKIVLPESLLELTPLHRDYSLKEYDKEPDNCRLIYNPNGYKDKTWIVVYIEERFWPKLFGDYVLLYNKEIKQERDILEIARKTKGVKYYTAERLKN